MIMPSYSNYQSDNKKFTKNRTNIYNAELNKAVQSVGNQELDSFSRNLTKYEDFVSWARFYPDLFFDLITPELGSIRLDLDQRVFL
jgi:ribonucleoside-diphosphate reductase alpha chain